ncbi:MAG: hypothetical protein HY289_01305 [Planctomycetes bacterium]|nr:hypothetical protein [Planctomycetota bacterium]
MFKPMIAVALSATFTLSASAQPTRKASKLDLDPQSSAKLHALIRPHENEWRHLKVEWLTDVVAARKKAASEDKPIVICYTGGAGYNEPLGVC